MSAFDSPLDQWWSMSCMRGYIDCIEVVEGENVLRVVCDERIREELVSPRLCTVFIDVTERYDLPATGLVRGEVRACDASTADDG